MSDNKQVVIAEIEHLHNRINGLLGIVDFLATMVHDDATPEQKEVIIARLQKGSRDLAATNVAYDVARMEGRGLSTYIRKLIGQPVDVVEMVEEPAIAGAVIDWNRMLIANGNNLVYRHLHDDSPLAKVLSPISLDQLGNVNYELTQSGVYTQVRDNMTAFVTILRIERDGELKHFVMIPYGAGVVEFRTFLKDEGVWISHSDTRVVSTEDVRNAIFGLLNEGFDETPPQVDSKAAYTALYNALEDRKPGDFVQGIEVVYDPTLGEGVLSAIHHSTQNHALSLYIDRIDDQEQYRIELTGTLMEWSELHPLMQQQLIRDFAVDLFSNEADRLEMVEAATQAETAVEAVAANDDD